MFFNWRTQTTKSTIYHSSKPINTEAKQRVAVLHCHTRWELPTPNLQYAQRVINRLRTCSRHIAVLVWLVEFKKTFAVGSLNMKGFGGPDDWILYVRAIHPSILVECSKSKLSACKGYAILSSYSFLVHPLNQCGLFFAQNIGDWFLVKQNFQSFCFVFGGDF